MIRNIFALCAGSSAGKNPRYAAETRALADYLGRRPLTKVKFGGVNYGLMGEFAVSFMQAAKQSGSGAMLEGIIAQKYHRGETEETAGYPIIVTRDPDENNALFTGPDTQALIYLPGGTGTFSEFFAQIEKDRNMSEGMRPAFILNANGFFRYHLAQLDHSVKEGFTSPELISNVHQAPNARKLSSLIQKVMDKSPACQQIPA